MGENETQTEKTRHTESKLDTERVRKRKCTERRQCALKCAT